MGTLSQLPQATNTVSIQIRSVYGKEVIYPMDANAKRFAAIAGTKTLSVADMSNIQALGFAVRIYDSEQPGWMGVL